MEAYTSEENVTIKAPVIILKLTKDEAKSLIRALNSYANDVAWTAVGILTNELEKPSSKNTVGYD
jgi:hypothetical protein